MRTASLMEKCMHECLERKLASKEVRSPQPKELTRVPSKAVLVGPRATRRQRVSKILWWVARQGRDSRRASNLLRYLPPGSQSGGFCTIAVGVVRGAWKGDG